MSRVLVRFPDDEVMEGDAPDLDIDRADFELIFAETDTNRRRALISLPAVKCVTMRHAPLEDDVDLEGLDMVALRFRDGEVLEGLVREAPRRGRHGLLVELLSPSGDEVMLLGIPYASLKGVFFLSGEAGDAAGHGPVPAGRRGEPLLDLLGEIRSLERRQRSGEIDADEFTRCREAILDRF